MSIEINCVTFLLVEKLLLKFKLLIRLYPNLLQR